jgi:hypothetical protein
MKIITKYRICRLIIIFTCVYPSILELICIYKLNWTPNLHNMYHVSYFFFQNIFMFFKNIFDFYLFISYRTQSNPSACALTFACFHAGG